MGTVVPVGSMRPTGTLPPVMLALVCGGSSLEHPPASDHTPDVPMEWQGAMARRSTTKPHAVVLGRQTGLERLRWTSSPHLPVTR